MQLRAAAAHLQGAGRFGDTSRAATSPLECFCELGGVERYGDLDLRRKFVRALLTEELGEELANQPEFERISNEVWSLIEEDETLRPQLEEALRQLGRR